MGFGNMKSICERATIPLCNLVSAGDNVINRGVIAKCYSRSIYLANTVIFQIGNTIINLGALALVVMIIFNIRGKFTAIGRAEMMYFFACYFVLTCFSIINDCGVSPPGSKTYGYLVAVQNGFSSACCWTLMVNGFVCFEFWEDGKRKSLIVLGLSSACAFLLTFIMSAFTFEGSGSSVNSSNTLGLFIVLYVLNAIFLFIYVISQMILSLFVLHNFWAFGSLLMSTFFLIMTQILVYVLSNVICNGCDHYLDGLFFGTLSQTLAAMMIYKYWDIITAEDLEFSVSSNDVGIGGVRYHDLSKSTTNKLGLDSPKLK